MMVERKPQNDMRKIWYFPGWTDYMIILNEMHNNGNFAVFHSAIKAFKNFVEELKNEKYFTKKTEVTMDRIADIKLGEGEEYFVTNEGWDWLLKRRVLTEEEMQSEKEIQKALPNKENRLLQLLDLACKLILKEQYKKEENDNKKKERIDTRDSLMEEDIAMLVQEEAFVKFLYDYICFTIIHNSNTKQNKDYFIGKVKTGVEFGNHLCRILIARRADDLDKLITEIEETRISIGLKWSEHQLHSKLKIILAICEANNFAEIKFEELNMNFEIKSEEIKKMLFYYLKNKMQKLQSFLRYLLKHKDKLSKQMRSRIIGITYMQNSADKLSIKNNLSVYTVLVGMFAIENIYVKHNILEEVLGIEEGKVIRKADQVTKTRRSIIASQYGYTIDPAIIGQITTNYKIDVPILNPIYDDLIPQYAKKYEKFRLIYEQENHIIHANENITMKIHSDNILHQEKGEISVKYCIDFHYFARFMWLLVQLIEYLAEFKEEKHLFYQCRDSSEVFYKAYIQMHNINLARYEELVEKYPQTGPVMEHLHYEVVQFKKFKTRKEIMKGIMALAGKDKRKYLDKDVGRRIRKYRGKYWFNDLPHRDLIQEFIDIMCHRKLFIIRLITDCIEHVAFDHFTVRHFLDARGRVYPRITYMNINGNHPAKLFVRLYDENKNAPFTQETQLNIIKHLKNKETRRKTAALDISTIERENNRIKEEYILSLCHKDCTIEDVRDWINNIMDYHRYPTSAFNLLDRIKAKKPKEQLFIHSLVYAQRYIIDNPDARFIAYAEKDATSSGLQMISILFRSESLASYANLVSGNTKDIYSLITAACKEHKNYLLYIANHTLNYVGCPHHFSYIPFETLKLNEEEIDFLRKEIKTLSAQLPATGDRHFYFLLLLFKIKIVIGSKRKLEKFGTFLITIFNFFIRYMPEVLLYYDSITFEDEENLDDYLSEKEILLVDYLSAKSKFNALFWKKILVIRAALRLTLIVKVLFPFLEQSNIWEGRDLFKQAVMTRFYNSTSFGRVKDFIECLKTHHLLPQGYEDNRAFKEFISFLDNFFVNYLGQIPDTDKLDTLSKVISNKKNSVLINNQFFFIEIAPKKMYTKRIVSSFRRKSKTGIKKPQICLKFYAVEVPVKEEKNAVEEQDPSIKRKRKRKQKKQPIHDESKLVDHRKLCTMVGPNIIHSMDSTIVHLLYNLVCAINEFSDFKLVLEMNHDCYILSCPVLLPILLEECYLLLCKMNYLQNISDLSLYTGWKHYQSMNMEDFKKLLTPINPRFIK